MTSAKKAQTVNWCHAWCNEGKRKVAFHNLYAFWQKGPAANCSLVVVSVEAFAVLTELHVIKLSEMITTGNLK